MANTQPGIFSARMTDTNGVSAACTAYVKVDPSATVAQLQTDLQAWLVLLNGVSTARIDQASISVQATGGAIGTNPAGFSDSDVINTMVIDFLVPDDGSTWGFAVPSYLDSLKSDGKFVVSSGAIADLAGDMGANAHETFQNNHKQALGALKSAFPTGRKRRGAITKGRGSV